MTIEVKTSSGEQVQISIIKVKGNSSHKSSSSRKAICSRLKSNNVARYLEYSIARLKISKIHSHERKHTVQI